MRVESLLGFAIVGLDFFVGLHSMWFYSCGVELLWGIFWLIVCWVEILLGLIVAGLCFLFG